MQHLPAIAGLRLQRMAECVAEVEQRPGATLALVQCDHGGLRLATDPHRLRQRFRLQRQHAFGILLQPGPELRLIDQAVFRHFRIAGEQLPARQARQHVGIRQHQARLMEGANQVLAMAGVDRGLATDRAIDLAQQRRRHLHIVDAAQQNRRQKAAQVPHHAAAQRYQKALAVQPGVQAQVQ